MDDEGVESDPFAAIGGQHRNPGPYVELYLCDQGIGYLVDFERFLDLKHLWLSRNKLRRLEGLEGNFRLQTLHLSHNQITTLAGSASSIGSLLHLEELIVDNNKLEDLTAHLAVLSRLRRLKTLDLSKNPLADETSYRLHLIKALPWLETLDRIKITPEERALAEKVKHASLALEAPSKRKAVVVDDAEARAVVGRIARRVMEKRVMLRPHWSDLDRRKPATGLVSRQAFLDVLNRYGLLPMEFTQRELQETLLVARYATNGRVDYLRFCRDVEPRGHRSRDTFLLKEEQKCVPEISSCLRLAMRVARDIRNREDKRKELIRARMVGEADDTTTRATTAPCFTSRACYDSFKVYRHDHSAKQLCSLDATYFKRTTQLPPPKSLEYRL